MGFSPTAGLGDYIQKIFDRLLKAGQIDKNQVKATFDTLYKGVEKGYGKKLINLDYETPDAKKLAFMKSNVFVFSAYKSYQNVLEINKALYDDKGIVRPFNDFKKLATGIDDAFNKRYLETEYNMAVLSGRAAAQWQEFESMADTYPLLQYQTIGDVNVRPEHEALNNVIRPINDPFWTIFYPPNDWGCRCDVVQVTDENAVPTKKEDIKAPDMKEIFKNNVGITGKVFPDSHPYFDVLPEHIVMGAAILWGLALPENTPKKAVDLQDMKEIVDKELRTSVLEQTRKSLVVGEIKVTREELKSDIIFTTKGLKEALNQPHYAYNEKNKAVLNIVELLKNSKYIGFKDDTKERVEVRGFHYFETQIQGRSSYILVMERKTGENIFYTISDKE